jgi:hypothetical protein
MEVCSVALVILLTGYIIRECLPPRAKTKIANPASRYEKNQRNSEGLPAKPTSVLK